MYRKRIALGLCVLMLLAGCAKTPGQDFPDMPDMPGVPGERDFGGDTLPLEEDDPAAGEAPDNLGLYDGFFGGDSEGTPVHEISIECISGTPNAYVLDGDTLRFTAVGEETVYAVSGKFTGNIVIDPGADQRFELEFRGFSLISHQANPITVLSGDKVTLTAKKNYENYLYDMRNAVDAADETLHAGAIYAAADLEISGKGAWTVVSENNNGIHTKDDLSVKNLTLTVACVDNALKGNDSVEITGGNLTLIATGGDGIKTSNSNISEKGNQRGTVTIAGGSHTIYAACDGIDAAYDVHIEGEDTVLSIFTDKYSAYSEEVTAVSAEGYYIRFTSNQYKYSVKYSNSDSDFLWVNAEYHSSVEGGRSTYYYYAFPKQDAYSRMQFFIYSSDMEMGQDTEYLVASDAMTPNTAYDTFALTSRGNQLSYSWTNYTTKIREGGFGGRPGGPGGPGGFGGMQDGNTDKGDYSTKGIKAANEIVIAEGTTSIKSYDDAIHANNDTALENGESALGHVTVSGGTLTLYSNDDGIHADGAVSITAGRICIENCYEGVEGNTVHVAGGAVSVIAKDDGINATTTTGTAVRISGGTVYIYCSGDGIDSNSRTSYAGIAFDGGNTVVISTSGGNSAIDTEQGYSYTGGAVVAIMPRGGMSGEATHCRNFTSVGKATQLTLTGDQYLVAGIGDSTATVRIPATMSAQVIVLGDPSPTLETTGSVTVSLDDNGVCWE